MPLHRIYFDGELSEGEVVIGGDEAHHAARVKRLGEGDRVQVLDGRGRVAEGTVGGVRRSREGWELVLKSANLRVVEPVRPRVEVCSAAPKGSRLGDMIEGLSQVGAASWRFLETDHGAVEPRPGKLDRLVRTAVESSKQCGRAWMLEIGEPVRFEDAIAPSPGIEIVLANADGEPCPRPRAGMVRLLIGPEGGWSQRELAAAAGVTSARFGPHIMRIETAAVVGAASLVGTAT